MFYIYLKFFLVVLGGTLDITAHQYIGPDHLREFHCASGENLGGILVDQIFERHLTNAFGEEKVHQIKRQNPSAWIQLMYDFELAKKTVSSSDVDEFVYLNSSSDCSWGWKMFQVKRILYGSNTSDLNLKGDGRIFFPQSTLLKIIIDISARIKNHICNFLENEDLKGIDAVLLVGGFAKSPFIRDALENLVGKEIPLIEPNNSELCVVKGAVMFGWKKEIIRSRKSRFTYGFEMNEYFIEGRHDESKGWYDNTRNKACKNIFKKLVTINEDLQINQCVETICYHGFDDTPSTRNLLFCSKDPDPKYTDDEGVTLIGEIEIPKSKDQHGKKITQLIYFGDTDIYVKITDQTTETTYHERFDFFIDKEVKFV